MTTVSVDPARVELDIHPPLDWILVRLDEPLAMTRGGIHAPAQSVPPARSGVIVRQGPGALSDDGRTRLPMAARVGDRVLFERAAGKNLPRCPVETSERAGWGYVLMRDGSICAVVAHEPVEPGEQRALDSGAAGIPAAPAGGVPVSRRGELTAERLTPVQDWLVLLPDAPLGEIERPFTVARPDKRLRSPNGKPLPRLALPDRAQSAQPETEALWSATVLKRGPGLLTVTRCLDGDRLGFAPRLVEVGQRCLLAAQPPYAQPIDDLWPLLAGKPFLAREYPCVAGVLTG